MKKSSLVLLGLIAGLALTSCNNDGYIECSEVVLDNSRTVVSTGVYHLVAKYRSKASFSFSTKEEDSNGYYYSYFYFYFYKERVQPEFPNHAFFKVKGYNSTLKINLEFVSLIGKYETYNKVFLSKDKKKLKYTEATFDPVSAPKDKEVQGQPAGEISLNTNYELDDDFTTPKAITFKTSIQSTYMNIEGKEIQYTVIEK